MEVLMKLFKKLKSANDLKVQEVTQREKIDNLKKFSNISVDETLTMLGTRIEGLTAEEVEARREEYGFNEFEKADKHTMLGRLFEAIINPFNIILLLIAAVSFVTDVVISPEADYLTIIIILFMVTLSSVVTFIQSRNSDKAAANLQSLVANTCHVYRDNELVEINIDEVVPGDIVYLSSGDMLPADVRFIRAKDTFISQSALTGESQPVEKYVDVKTPNQDLSDIENIALLGSDLVSGSALAVILTTGSNTYFSSIADAASSDKAESSYDRGIYSVSKLLLRMMILLVPIVFVINAFFKNDWLNALLFSVSLAVGLTPEMLPVIMTTTLSRGAVNMSKRKVIVRKLGSIQTFGEMDILCTDKTGTLTEDKIVLEKYMNLNGQDDRRVLRHAYLNSYFQTGLKNLIDIAVINRANKYEMSDILNDYERIDEVPFDFARRRMSVVLEDKNGKRQLITKGAVEEVMDICSFAEINGEVLPLEEREIQIAMDTYREHNDAGLRMLAVAQKNEVPEAGTFSVEDESDMVLIGFIAFLDPPKESSEEAIRILKEYGVRPIVLTGDSEGVAMKVCQKVGIDVHYHYQGHEVEAMSDAELENAVEKANLFSKLSPMQKERVVQALQAKGHTVGYMGDGINDTPALRQADVGISVDSAVDIAKETADIILLEKDLMVLENGIIEGRKTFGNMMKYLKLAVSGNVGNMISVIVASIFLPFLPMLPVQILAQNLLNDFAQMGIALDNVDAEYVRKPKRWDTKEIQEFMWIMGPVSSIFDICIFIALWFGMGFNTIEQAIYFQAGWFVFGTISQILIIYLLRTGRIPFFKSKPAKVLVGLTLSVSVAVLALAFTPLAISLDMGILSWNYMLYLIPVLLGYALTTEWVKGLMNKGN